MNKIQTTIIKNIFYLAIEVFKIVTKKTWWIAAISSIIPISYTVRHLIYGKVVKFENYAIFLITLILAYIFLAITFTFLTFILERDIINELKKDNFDSKYWARKIEILR